MSCAHCWLHEDDAQEELIRYAAALTHAQGLRFLWIPFSTPTDSAGGRIWGLIPPFCSPTTFLTARPPSRSPRSLRWHDRTGWGLSWNLTSAFEDAAYCRRYLDYLEGAAQYGYGGPDVFKGYYQDVKALLYAARGAGIHGRTLYEKHLSGTRISCGITVGVLCT